MSTETLAWLNANTLIGFTTQRGQAWHYRASDQGGEPNHYPGAIPVADVHRRLFHWRAESRPVYVGLPGVGDDPTVLSDRVAPAPVGVEGRLVRLEDRQAITRSDTDRVLGVFKDGYVAHQPGEWLVDSVERILGADLGIGSAGLLRGGAVAWVQVEVPESVSTPEGLTFRPQLLAATSFDGSVATTYARTAGIVVCDNTLSAAFGEKTIKLKVKHSRYSHLRLSDARDALDVVTETAEDVKRQIHTLATWEVPTRAWSQLLDATCAVDGGAKTSRSATLAGTKREALERLYRFDPRCAPWQNTALGVLQAFNTWSTHEQTVRNTERAERTMLRVITGSAAKADTDVLERLADFVPAPA